MKNLLRRHSVMAVLAVLMVGCSSQQQTDHKKYPPLSAKDQIKQHLPANVKDKVGWSQDIYTALDKQNIPPTLENICSVIAVAGQESGFDADARVSGLPKIAWGEINRKAAAVHVPEFFVRTALKLPSGNGESYASRLDKVTSERELSAIYDDLIDTVPLGQRLFGKYNPIHTGGPMQVSISFAEQHADNYPYKIDKTIRREVFTRRGGVYFGTMHLLGFPANYSTPLYRFADYNAGWYASRNAAFQAAVSQLTGKKLALDGDLIIYGSDKVGSTEAALQTLSDSLNMSYAQIRRDLEKGQQASFEQSQLWQQVFRLADRKMGRQLAREQLPGIALKSPKITRNLTTAWFAQRVNQRYQQCLKQ